jgi:ArsR family transcriptional regulator, arsenate/arsenite/antimonite-responsive transcriptional repressor
MSENRSVLFAKALADETRQEIMQLCCCQWISVGNIVEQLSVSQPTVSHHLAVLRDAGLVESREEGKQTYYRLNQRFITNCCGQLMLKFAPGEDVTRMVSIKTSE